MPTSTSSTPQSRQAIEEGLQEHDQEQLKAEGDECSTDQGPDIDWTDQVMDDEDIAVIRRLNDGLELPAVETPSKRGLKKKLPNTPEASTSITSSGGSSVPLKWHPSPAKRWKHATENLSKPPSPAQTLDNQIQELRDVIQHGPAELQVSNMKYL